MCGLKIFLQVAHNEMVVFFHNGTFLGLELKTICHKN